MNLREQAEYCNLKYLVRSLSLYMGSVCKIVSPQDLKKITMHHFDAVENDQDCKELSQELMDIDQEYKRQIQIKNQMFSREF
jgi:hypothetical protein